MSGRKGQPRPTLEPNDVTRALDALKARGTGPSALVGLLGVSVATIARWRLTGFVADSAHLRELVKLVEKDERKRWRLVERLSQRPEK